MLAMGNHDIGGVMVSVLTMSVVDPRSNQRLGNWYLLLLHVTLRR
jgi:hypothetical protein